jgi:hypothetical protein
VSWQEQREQRRRLDEAARAEQVRRDAVAAAEVDAIRTRTRVEATQTLAEQRTAEERQRRAERRQAKDTARAQRRARWAGARAWAAAHTVDLMIYPLAVVSAVMAVPAMAVFGHDVYGTAAGYALPVITELGMWAFAFAVHLTRHRCERDGVDRPVWAFQTGTWCFAAVAAGLNFLHGMTARPAGVVGDLLAGAVLVPPAVAGVVMAVASVAGVMAHQLVTAAPRRGRTDREAARIERQAAAKVARVRRAALRAAVAEIGQDGDARLLFHPGHYRLTRPRLTPWRSRRLDAVAVPGLPVTPALEDGWDDLDHELATLLATVNPYPDTTTSPDHPASPTPGGGGVGTLDRDRDDRRSDRRESTPTHHSDAGTDRPVKRPRSGRKSSPAQPTPTSRKSGQKSARSIEDLRAELHRLIEADSGSIDLSSAESIRRALRCSPARARALRDTTAVPTDRGDTTP